jgi:anti-sigma factor RsiW
MSRPADRPTCDAVLELLEAFADGDLGPGEERMVMAHLDACAACRREHRVAADLRSTLRSLPEHDAPAKVLWAVRMAVREGGSRTPLLARLAGRIARPAAAVAAAAVVAAVMVTALAWWQRPAPRPSLDDPEIARAAQQTRFALGLVGALGRRAALDEVLGRRVVAPAVEGVAEALRAHLGSGGSDDGTPEPQPKQDKGVNG